jgi:hypothetical protein
MNTAVLQITSCIDCPFHSVEDDPDPYDWFCSDDVKVVCKKSNRNITVACRPHKIRKESNIPDWCPLKKETKP